jgi:nucleoside phosphorylase
MLLLSFAHKAEAQVFIRRKHNVTVDFYFPGVFRHEDELLLITGMGIETTMQRTRKVLDYFGDDITEILNLGVAGALNRQLQINQIYGVKTVYHADNPETFMLHNPRPQINCITVNRMVDDDAVAHLLQKKAAVVDMELWGCCSIAAKYNIPVRSYKLISDYAGSDTDPGKIRQNAEEFSRHLFDFYKKLPSKKSDIEIRD